MNREEFLEEMDLAPNHQDYISSHGLIKSMNLQYNVDGNSKSITISGKDSNLEKFLLKFDSVLQNSAHQNDVRTWMNSKNKNSSPHDQLNLRRYLRVYYRGSKIEIGANISNSAKGFYFNGLIAPVFYETLDRINQ